jgi:hypothetical protein
MGFDVTRSAWSDPVAECNAVLEKGEAMRIGRFFCYFGIHKWTPWKSYRIPETVAFDGRSCGICGKHQSKNIVHLNSWLRHTEREINYGR